MIIRIDKFYYLLPPEIARERGPGGQVFVWQGYKGKEEEGA